MDDLISKKYLYDKMLEKEELARQRVLDTPTHSPAYLRYVAQMNERTALKHEIADAPDVTDTNVGSKWIPCSERMPDKEYELYWTTHEDGSIVLHGYTKKNGFIYNWEVDDLELRKRQGRVVAWMLIPMPEPYKGE